MSNSEKILAMYESLRMDAFVAFGRKWAVFEMTGEGDFRLKAKAIVTLEQELQSLDYQKQAILDSMEDINGNVSKKPF